MEYSKTTLESNIFSLTLGIGIQKKATLDVAALMELLDSINLDSNCIKEITVNYRNERKMYYSQIQEHFKNTIEIGEDYEIKTIWEDKPIA